MRRQPRARDARGASSGRRGLSPSVAGVAARPWSLAFGALWFVGACGDDDARVYPSEAAVDASAAPDAADAAIIVDAAAPDALATCASDRECVAPSVCRAAEATVLDLEPHPLTCGVPSSAAPSGSPCTSGDECARGLCVLAGTCVSPCFADADCDLVTERCAEVFARRDAVAGWLRACVPRFALPADVTAHRETRPGALIGAPRRDEIVLSSTDPATLHVLSTTSGFLRPLRLVARDDETVLFDVERVTPGDPAPLNPLTSERGLTTMVLVPSGARVVDAEVALELMAERPGDLDVVRVSGALAGNVLDVDVFYVGGGGLTSSDPAAVARVERALDVARDTYASAGVALGDVRHHEVVGLLRGRLGVIESSASGGAPELASLFALSAGLTRPSVAVFLVRVLDAGLGIAGGVPGPCGLPGTSASGVAIAVDMFEPGSPGAEIGLGRAIAHEIGHFLGLFHTSEPRGQVLDAFPDTPECRLERDGDGDGFLTAEECEGAGADHLMFWAATGTAVSLDQTVVLRRAPILRVGP